MSAYFYISPNEKRDASEHNSDLKVDLNLFTEEMKEKWPEINIYEQPESNSYASLRWELNFFQCDTATDCMSGEMLRDQQSIFIDAHSSRMTIARFALLYRKLVLSTYRLFVFPSWSSNYFELLTNINEAQIVQSLQGLGN